MRVRASVCHISRVALCACICVALQAQTPAPTQPPKPAPQQPAQQPAQQPPGQQQPAQPAAPKPAAPGEQPAQPDETPANPSVTPGTINPSQSPQKSGELDETADQNANAPDYTGPSILSRGYSLSRPSLPTNERFRPFFGVNFLYDSGLTGPFVGPNNSVVSTSSNGLDVSFGISGRHIRRKDIFQLEYRGHTYWYNSNTRYNGQDHSLDAGYTRTLNPHFTISIHEVAGWYANNYSVLNATSITDISTGNIVGVNPNTESFDDRTFFSTSSVDLVYRKNSRLSFDIGGSEFFVKRHSAALTNSQGYQTHADAVYRVTKRTSIGAFYGYTFYKFSHAYGDSDVQSVGLTYSYAFTRTMELKLRAGGSLVESSGLAQVSLSPIVAIVLGQSFGLQRFYQRNFVPDFGAEFTKQVQHASVGASAAFGVSPGNGLYLTSRHDSESAYFNYNGLRTYGFGVAFGRDRLSSLGTVTGSYASYYGRFSGTHTLPHHLNGMFSAEVRQLGFSLSGYHRKEYRITAGIAYAPGEGPLKFW